MTQATKPISAMLAVSSFFLFIGFLPSQVSAQCNSPGAVGGNVDLEPVTVSCDDNNCSQHELAWNGSGYGLVRNLGEVIYFDKIGPDGVVLGTTEVANDPTYGSFSPALAWNGTGYGVAFSRRCGFQCSFVYFVRLDADGNRIGSEIQISLTRGGGPEILWNGSEYGAVWTGTVGAGNVRFARLDANGARIGQEIELAKGFFPSVAWTGSEYGVAWCNMAAGGLSWDCFFARVHAAGNMIGDPLQLTDEFTEPQILRNWTSVAWSGTEYGVVWKGDANDGSGIEQIYFRRVSSSGTLVGTTRMVSYPWSGDSLHPEMVWNGDGYTVAYQDYGFGNYEIYLAILDSSGNEIDQQRLTTTADNSEAVSLVLTDEGFGLSWQEGPDAGGVTRVMFTRVECCNDVDLDGLTVCDGDCDDDNSAIYPGAPQICDGLNNDCNDPDWPALTGTNEIDGDADGYTICEGDCDDSEAAAFPGNPEVCDDLDNNCDGTVDEGLDTDVDGDGYNVPGSCHGPFDCDDNNAAVNPGLPEFCNDGLDNDCDVLTPDIFDGDLDGYTCVIDCDDSDPAVNPGAPEVCNDGLDNDCNPATPDIFDGDGDGYLCATDCNDGDPSINPGAAEIACDGLDNDCNPATADIFDGDGDGYACDVDCDDTAPAIHPGAAETGCDGLDNDCDPATPDVLDGDGDGSVCDVDCDDHDDQIQICNTPCCGDFTTSVDGHTVTMDVTSGGDTTVTAEPCNPAQLDGFLLTTPSTPCINVMSDAGFDPPAEVCINYDDTGLLLSQEQALQMFSCDGAIPPNCEPVPLTPEPPPNPNTDTNMVCGLADHFSILAVGVATDSDGDGTPDLLDNCRDVINFLQFDSDGDGWGDACDCAPADPASFPGGTEFCDGADNDCDLAVDEGCVDACGAAAPLGTDARTTNGPGGSGFASMVWTGSEYGVAWHDERDGNWEIYFARLDASGARIGSEVRVTIDAAESGSPSIAWTGSEYGIAWWDGRDGNREIYFCALDPAGNKIRSDKRLTNAAAESSVPSLVWTGRDYGVAWHDDRDGNREIYFARLHISGNAIGPVVRVTNDGAFSGYPSLAWTGSHFGIAWHDDRDGNEEIYLARLDPTGGKIGADTRLTSAAGVSGYPSLAWTGFGYGVSWHDERDGNWEIYFARLYSNGTRIGSDVRVTSEPQVSGYPSLIWTGSEYGVAWHDWRDSDWEIYFAIIDPSGTKRGADARVTSAATGSYAPSLVWAGGEYGVAWHDERDGNLEVYFSRVGCCVDVDLDGFTVCANDCNDNDGAINPGASEVCDSQDNNCDGAIDEGFPTPGVTGGLALWGDAAMISWDVELLADRYEVMRGDLVVLRSTGGDFTASLTSCIENDSLDTQAIDAELPLPGQAFYYVVRAERDCKTGTCNAAGSGQQGDRDAEIDLSSNVCP